MTLSFEFPKGSYATVLFKRLFLDPHLPGKTPTAGGSGGQKGINYEDVQGGTTSEANLGHPAEGFGRNQSHIFSKP